MIHFINEGGNSELKHRVFPLSKGIKKHLIDTLRNYRGDKTIEGYKRLNNLLSMTNGISYSEMKRLKNFFDNYQGTDKSVEFLLNGGEPMKLWVNNTLYTATKAIHDFKQAKKDAGISNAFIKSHEKNRQSKKKNKPTQVKFKTNNVNKNISNNELLKFENVLHENYDSYYGTLDEYGINYVLNSFLENPQGKQNWLPLINPSMYHKALEEFTKFGKIEKFPSKYIYQWMGIIMRNTAQLRANTELAGHTQLFPYEEFSDFLSSYFGNEDWNIENDNVCYIDENGELQEINIFDFCYNIGLYDWMQAPDGSDAWSDYGLNPIEKLISEYDENQTPEEVLVLINKILDVYHCRGDLASLFVNGGTKALTQVSNGMKESKIINITENQFKIIKNKLNEAADNQFSTEELSNLRSFKERYNYCVEHLGQPQGKGSSRVCFQIDDEKILKLAWNNKGIAQNENETDYYLDDIGIVPHTYDSDDNGLWIISEYVLPARQRDFKECLGLTFYEFVKFIRSSCAWRENYTRAKQGAYGDYIYSLDEYSDMCENEDLQPFDEYIGDYRPPESDLTRLCNYGMTMRNGYPTIVLLDAGLSQEIWNNYYDKSRR